MTEETEKPDELTGFSGQLSETPLFVVLRRIQRERLTGTLSVFRDDQVRQLFFDNGELHAARSSREEHRIGATLVRWGYVSQQNLEEALQIQKETHQRIDQILVGRGWVTRVVVDGEARQLMQQILFSTLSWPDGPFHFEQNTDPLESDVAVALSAEMIIEGVRRIPESEQFLELLGDLSAVPILTRDPRLSVSFRLLQEAIGLLSRIDGKTDAAKLLREASSSETASAKILYSLLFAGIIEMQPPGTATASVRPGESHPAAPATETDEYVYDARKVANWAELAELADSARIRASRSVSARPTAGAPPPNARQLVMDTYRQLDWLSHYDLLGISRKATSKEIEEAFRGRSLLFDPSLKAHPELVDCWRQLTVLAKWLRVAYGVLSKPDSREAYDRKIEETNPPEPAGSGKP